MKIIIMILTLLFIANVSFAKEKSNTTNSINSFNDISWSEVTKAEKVKKIIGRITILRMLGVVPASFWKEFGLDLDEETLDWEKIDGIDLDMVLSAHKDMTQAIENKLNEKNSTLGGEEFLRVMILIKSLKILDYKLINGKILDENNLPIGNDLKKKIKDRIAELIKNRENPDNTFSELGNNNSEIQGYIDFVSGLGSDPMDNFDPNNPLSSLTDMINRYTRAGENWKNNTGIVQRAMAGEGLFALLVYDAYETLRAEANGNNEEAKTRGCGALGNWIGETIFNITHDDGSDPDAPWSENKEYTGSGTPTPDDIDNINKNTNSHGGTTYVEGKDSPTKMELKVTMKRIDVIKNQYGVNCNEATGEGCGIVGKDYKNDSLQNGDAITNPGAKL